MKPIFIVSGEKGSGKTTFLIKLSNVLQMNGHTVDGFLARHNFQSDCYLLKNIKNNEETPLMQRVATFENRPHHFKFFPEGIKAGNNWIKELLAHSPDIAVVDEIGGYELSGELWCSSFTQLVESSIPLMFATKAKQLEKVIRKWNIEPTLIFNSDDFNNPQKAFERMKSYLL